ncbi:carbon-nitrogen hydrolase family protein [Poseidonocella sedimentorum]|uniref:Predicted amidohydrolase n=1 Tax=Poseidonocella sedimentorum TaxID=871652 RepID=A0A1I6CN91_9RHOB|nr:carbon-nitrogen hydrolase family protein [Poseidonocella sedimentorum]SFQ94652.1 Predicted amidohydrolase [Poseidonocella sedimentorum]
MTGGPETLRIAAAAYPLDVLDSWEGYVRKLETWVAGAAEAGAQLLVFPEYGSLELATLAGPEVAADLERSLRAVAGLLDKVDALHSALAARFGVHILGASAPVFDPAFGPRPANRARLYAPSGPSGAQDKQIMTCFERSPWEVIGGGPLRLFDTALGRIGVLICYDSEFPLLGRALAEADILLVPSCTDTEHGYWRVRLGTQARALENQCIAVMSSTVGAAPWSPAVDVNVGAGGIFAPPDTGFPANGVLGVGALNAPGWTFADIDLAAIRKVRATGDVRNRAHWPEQAGREGAPEAVCLR